MAGPGSAEAEDSPVETAYRDYFRAPYCDPALGGVLLGDIAERLGGEQGAALKRNFAQFLSRQPSAQKVRWELRHLGQMALDAGLEAPFAGHDQVVIGERLSPFLSALEGEGGGRRVLFVAHRPYFLILREALHLKKQGWRPFLASVEPLPEALRPLFATHFEGIVDMGGDHRSMKLLLERARVEVIHVQCWMWSYFLGRLAIETRNTAKVVCEFYDVTSLFADRDALADNWPALSVDVDVAMETYILRHADAVLTRFPADVVDAWYGERGGDVRHMRLMPYPCAAFTDYGDGKLSAGDGVRRFVYAGGLIRADAAHPEFLFPEATMVETFRALLNQGFAVDVLHDPHQPIRADDPDYAPYIDLTRRYPRFRIVDGVPPDRLSEALAPYDFGLLLFRMDMDVVRLRDTQLRGVVATKVFAYLEAGLPPVVNAEYREMARLLTEEGIGLALSSADIPRLGAIVAAFDYAGAVERIKAFNASHTMEGEVGRLVALYEDLLG